MSFDPFAEDVEAVATDDPFAADPFAVEPTAAAPDDVAEPLTPLQIAVHAVRDAMEKSSFVTANESSEATMPLQLKRVTLTFGGPAAGTLAIVVDATLGNLLVANVLGIDEDDEMATSACDDSLRELVNVAAGAMMPRLVGDVETACPLGLPEVSPATASDWQIALNDGRHQSLDAEGRPLLVGLLKAA